MCDEKSLLLKMDIPEDLAKLALAEGIRQESAWLVTSTDLNLSGHYEELFLLVETDRLLTIGRPLHAQPIIRMTLQRGNIKKVRTRQGVGGGFLEALIDDVYVEILAYSNAKADAFHKVADKIQKWLAGHTPVLSSEDDYDPCKCPDCGLPLEFKGDICHRCMDKGAVFVRVLKLMRPYAARAVIMMLLVGVVIGLSLIPQQLVRILIDKVLSPVQAGNPVLPASEATIWLLRMVMALLATHVLIAVINMMSGRLASFVGTQITYDMRSRVFGHLTRLEVGYYDRYNIGQLMSRVVGDTEQMKGFVHQLTGGFMAQLITVVAVGVVLFSLNWKLALITMLPAPLVIMSAVFFWKRIYPRYYRVWDANSKLHGALSTILSGIRVVKAFGQERREQDRFARSSGYVQNSFRRVEYTVSLFNPSMGLIFQLGGILVWFVGGQWVLRQQLTLGALMAFLGYLWMFYNPLGQLTQLTNWLTQFLTATQRTFEILDTEPQIAEVKHPKALPAQGKNLRFDHVSFGYNRHEPIIQGISFEIKPGEHIGIVGKSGSGKTTLVNLILRFYDADEGTILIGGVDIRNVGIDEIRRHIGVVLQEPFLFRGTIYDNITYGKRDATPEQVLAVAKAANAHHFIIRHPVGYDTYIGEQGAGLSGGEKQRISIARALLFEPEILILDEATSNVDTESEQLIQEALARITKGRTTIAIAHRLSTLKNSDRILVIDDGKLVEQGTHEELLALQGIYHRLVKIQTELSREPNIDQLAAKKK